MTDRKESLKRRGGPVNVLLFIGVLVLCFLAVEIAFRIITPSYPPGTTYGKLIVKNSDSFRDREYAIPKHGDTYRIMFLGDSFTWGVGLDIEETIPKQIEKVLLVEIENLEVVNAAIPGYNTVQELMLLKDKGLKYEPDMIVLIYNLNDIQYLPDLAETGKASSDTLVVVPVLQVVKGRNYKAYEKKRGIRGVIWAMQKRLKFVDFLVVRVGFIFRKLGILDSLEFSWAERILTGYVENNLRWIETQRALREIKSICEDRNIPFIVAVFPFMNRLDKSRCQQVYNTITEYCEDINVPIIKLYEVFEGKNTRKYWINIGDCHPNAEAHRLATDVMAPVILSFVSADSSSQ